MAHPCPLLGKGGGNVLTSQLVVLPGEAPRATPSTEGCHSRLEPRPTVLSAPPGGCRDGLPWDSGAPQRWLDGGARPVYRVHSSNARECPHRESAKASVNTTWKKKKGKVCLPLPRPPCANQPAHQDEAGDSVPGSLQPQGPSHWAPQLRHRGARCKVQPRGPAGAESRV